MGSKNVFDRMFSGLVGLRPSPVRKPNPPKLFICVPLFALLFCPFLLFAQLSGHYYNAYSHFISSEFRFFPENKFEYSVGLCPGTFTEKGTYQLQKGTLTLFFAEDFAKRIKDSQFLNEGLRKAADTIKITIKKHYFLSNNLFRKLL